MSCLDGGARAWLGGLLLATMIASAAAEDAGMVFDPFGAVRTRTPERDASFRDVVVGETTREQVEQRIGKAVFPTLRSTRARVMHHNGALFDLADVAAFYREDDVVDRLILRFRRPEPSATVARALRLGPPTLTRAESGVTVAVYESAGVECETTPEGAVAALRLVARSSPSGTQRGPERPPRFLHLGEVAFRPGVVWAGRQGVEIGAYLEAPGLRGATVTAAVALLDESGDALRAAPGSPPDVTDPTGALRIGSSDTVRFDDSAWSPFRVFLPLDAVPSAARGRPVRASFQATCGRFAARSEGELALTGVADGTRLRLFRVAFVAARQETDASGAPGLRVEATFDAEGLRGAALEATVAVRDDQGRPIGTAAEGSAAPPDGLRGIVARASAAIEDDPARARLAFVVPLRGVAPPPGGEQRWLVDLEARAGGLSARRTEEVSVFAADATESDAVRAAVEAFLDATARGDTAAARRVAAGPLAAELDKRPSTPAGRAARVSRTLSAAQVEGSEATVEARLRFDDLRGLWSRQRARFRLTRGEDGWKVTEFRVRPVLPELEGEEVSR